VKATIAVMLLLAGVAPALAQGRPSTTRMTCSSAAHLVQSSRAIVLSTGGQTYDRFVVAEGYCPTGLYARAAFVPTRDNPQCYIGYYCSSMTPDFFD